MTSLKLVALDSEDLTILSTHLQDAIVQVRDLVYQTREKSFVMIVNRFDWEESSDSSATSSENYKRKHAALRFARVEAVQAQNISRSDGDLFLNLLSVEFVEDTPPGGDIFIRFSDDQSLRLSVECIEAELSDLSAAWTTKHKPSHKE